MVKKEVILMEFENNPNIGTFMFVNDKFCLLGKKVDTAKKKEIELVLKVPVYEVRVFNSDFIGVYVSGNNDFLFVPKIENNERKVLEEIGDKHGVKVVMIDDKINALGNCICCGDDVLIVNGGFAIKNVNLLKKMTGYDIVKLRHRDYHLGGSFCVFINGKFFVSQELDEKEIGKIMNKIGGSGTVNRGSPYISSGVVGNKFGLILGSSCSTIEIQNIVEGLDMI